MDAPSPAEIGEIQVFRHSPRPCRHCGHVYEHPCGGAGRECLGGFGHGRGPTHCPACGCPTLAPDTSRVSPASTVTGDGWRWGDAPAPPLEEQRELARKILARIKSGGGLEMRDWHTCETTHCLAGWAQVCRGLPEDSTSAYEAGVRLIPALAPWFFSTNDLAMKKLLELVKP